MFILQVRYIPNNKHSFLLSKLHLDSLSDKTTLSDLNKALAELPRGEYALSQAYGETIKRVKNQPENHRILAESVLTLLTCAERLLTTSELREALAVRRNTAALDEDKREHISIMVTACVGLVTVDERPDGDVIRLVHETTREYLATHLYHLNGVMMPDKPLSQTQLNELNDKASVDAHQRMSEICVTYISFSIFSHGACQTEDEFNKRLQQNPLYHYAACNWGVHCRKASTFDEAILSLLKSPPKIEASSQVLMGADRRSDRTFSEYDPADLTGLHLAAYFGLEEATSCLLANHDVDPKDSWARTPLWYASAKGHKEVAQQLIASKRVDINHSDKRGFTPIFFWANIGDSEMVKLLLEQTGIDPGYDVLKAWLDKPMPLSVAAAKGYITILKLLLNAVRVDVCEATCNPLKQTIYEQLAFAIRNGQTEAVKLLLEHPDVDADATPCLGHLNRRPLLSFAAEIGNEEIFRLLLERPKVNPDSALDYSYDKGRTPLSFAAEKGHEPICEVLLQHANVIPDSKSYYTDRTPLSFAAENGHEAICKLLLEQAGVNPDSKTTGDSWGRTPLSFAAEKGHEAVCKLLLQYPEVDPDSQERLSYRLGVLTPLWYAAEGGHDGIVRLLLATGKVDINTKIYGDGTPLLYAALNGHQVVVKILLDKIVPKCGDSGVQSAISKAIRGGHSKVVEVILANARVNLDSKDDGGRTLLLQAAQNGSASIMSLLLTAAHNSGTKPEHVNVQTLLWWAAAGGHDSLVRLLLEKSTLYQEFMDERDLISSCNQIAEMEDGLLCQKILALTTKDGLDLVAQIRNQTPLMWAAESGRVEVVRMMLQKGVDVNYKNCDWSSSPLELAAFHGHDAIVELLLAADGIDVDVDDGRPLQKAIQHGDAKIVKLIVEKGADLNIRETSGEGPLQQAVSFGHEAVVEFFLGSMRDFHDDLTIAQPSASMLMAAGDGNEKIVELLLDNGANLHHRDREGNTALSLAAERGYDGIVKMLRDRGADSNGCEDAFRDARGVDDSVQGHKGRFSRLLARGRRAISAGRRHGKRHTRHTQLAQRDIRIEK